MANSAATKRILEKLKRCISNGDFYEAFQLYKTLYFRYLTQKSYDDLVELLLNGATLLLDNSEPTTGCELAVLLVEVLQKSNNKEYEKWTGHFCKLLGKMDSELGDRDKFLALCGQWLGDSRSRFRLHETAGHLFWREKNYARARQHFIQSKNGGICAQLLMEYQRVQGFANEVDMFIVQLVFHCLCQKDIAMATDTFGHYTKLHPKIKQAEPPFCLPLLNFVFYMLKAIESLNLETFAVLCEKYKPCMRRDPCYLQSLDKIGQVFFGVVPPPPAATSTAPPITNDIFHLVTGGSGDEANLFGSMFQSILRSMGSTMGAAVASAASTSSSNGSSDGGGT